MTPPMLLGFLVLLSAVTHQNDLDSVIARLQRIHDIPTLFEEIEREGERALITVAINPAVYAFPAVIESFLERHNKFALGFGRYAQDAVYLAKLYLRQGKLPPDVRNELTVGVEEFEKWLANMSQRGLFAYDPSEEPPIYVGPGVDPSTEDLRQMLRLIHHESTEVPEDPIAGSELRLHMVSFARGLAILGFFPTDAGPEEEESLVRLHQREAAIFRLSFRRPDEMRFEDSERELVVESFQRTFQMTREGIAKWNFSEKYGKTAIELAERVRNLLRKREHEEL